MRGNGGPLDDGRDPAHPCRPRPGGGVRPGRRRLPAGGGLPVPAAASGAEVMSDKGLSRGQSVFMASLLLAGTALLAWAGYRAMYPRPHGPDHAAEAEADLARRGFKPLTG